MNCALGARIASPSAKASASFPGCGDRTACHVAIFAVIEATTLVMIDADLGCLMMKGRDRSIPAVCSI